MSVRIATSLRGRMRALASQGIFATDCYEQLHTLVLNHLGRSTPPCWPNPSTTARTTAWTGTPQARARPCP